MGLTYLLDANTLSNPAKLNPSELLMRKLAQHRGEVATAATAVHEMVYGYERLPEGRKRTRIAEYLEKTLLGIPVAFVNGLILVTDNRSDFEPFQGLSVENWLRSEE